MLSGLSMKQVKDRNKVSVGNRESEELKCSQEHNVVNNKMQMDSTNMACCKNGGLFSVNIQIDMMSVILLAMAAFTRFYRLSEPGNIVFDELHYGRYVTLYMKGIFFFDSHPPLGKQLISASARLAGYTGNFTFDKIGTPYTSDVPIFAMRAFPALCGSLLAPLVYNLMIQLKLSQWSAALAALLIIYDNALLTQSRFMLMESIMLVFGLFGIYCLLKYKHSRNELLGFVKWFWLLLSSISLICCMSVKYSGFYTCALGLYITGKQFWIFLGNKKTLCRNICMQIVKLTLIIVVLPVLIYLAIFAIHLDLLAKAGPHDSVMTSAFQASLQGGLASITKGQPIYVAHGSQITLRHTHGRTCWLHSHAHVYPIRYPDKRGSSHQQQVTCYSFKDVNNWWIVKKPEKNDLVVEYPIDSIKHGDVIQLVHGITSRALNSHDVAAPMSPQYQEVSCYIDYNVSMPAQNLWRVEITNRENDEAEWSTIQSQVHLIHVGTGNALKFSGRQLSDWGFNQHEVVADKVISQDDTVWNVEEHRYTKTDDKKERERQLVYAEMIPTTPTKLSFWDKFIELQYKMLFKNQEYVQNHMFSTEPLDWPLLTRGIAYWVSADTNAQIHLIGNVVIWYTATLGVVIYCALMIFYLLRQRRKCFDLPQFMWSQLVEIGETCLAGYLFNYIPYFLMERTLFLHHYLPAFVFKVLLLVCVIEHIYVLIAQMNKAISVLYIAAVVMWLAWVIQTFFKFSAINYGFTDLSEDSLVDLRWKDSWDFILHRK